MTGYYGHIETDTQENTFFRKVLFTAPHSQLVLMCLKPKEDIGMEVHEGNDQFFRFEKGEGRVIVGSEEFVVQDGDCIIVPAGEMHNIINTSETEELKLYTIYSPSHHPDGTIHKTKEEAMQAEEEEK